MERRDVPLIAGATVLAGLAIVAASSGDVRIWQDPSPSPVRSTTTRGTLDTVAAAEAPPLQTGRASGGSDVFDTVVLTGVVILVIVLAVLVIGTGVHAWRNRPRLRRRQATAARSDVHLLPDVADVVADDAASQRAALSSGSPRNAIVTCWLRLEQAVIDAGLERDPAHTSAEFTARVLAAYTLDPQPLDSLAALYREARFSRHDITEAQRERAIRDLDALHDSLRRPTVDAGAGAS